ncbi:MAG TPA: flippase, partial [Micromonosporaceae bacterium]|nr:flippase [Micromonosporaceae bacterium]
LVAPMTDGYDELTPPAYEPTAPTAGRAPVRGALSGPPPPPGPEVFPSVVVRPATAVEPDEPSDRQRADLGGVARGGTINMVGAIFSAAATFAVTVLVARGLGRGHAGVIFTATSALLMGAVFAKLGTVTGLVYWLSRLRTLGRRDLLRRCLSVALAPVLIASMVAAVALWFAAPALARVYENAGSNPGFDADFATQLRVLAYFLPLAALSDSLLAATRGYRTMRPTVLIERLFRPGLQLVALAVVLFAGAHTTVFTIAWIGPYLPSAALAFLWLTSLMRRDRRFVDGVGATADGASLTRAGMGRAFWRFTLPRALASVAQLALQRLDVLLIAGLLGFQAAAVYTVASRFVVVGQFGNQAISTAVEPRLAELLTRGDYRAANTLYQSSTGWLVLLAWPMYLGTAVFAPVYLSVFGHGYTEHDAIGVVLVLAVGTLFATGSGMVNVVLSMAGRTTWNMVNVILALTVDVVLNLVLIPRIGIIGAGIAWCAALVVNNALPLVQIGVSMRLHPFGRGTLCAGALAVVSYGGVGLLLREVLGPTVASCLLAAALGTVIYIVGVWRLRGPLALAAFRALRRGRGKGKGRTAGGGTAPDGATSGDQAGGEGAVATLLPPHRTSAGERRSHQGVTQ